jgi:membrane-bound serine protease (ClpP class)
MRRGFAAAVLLWIAAWGVLGAHDAVAAEPGRTVLTLSLNGVVDPFSASYVTRGIDKANAEPYVAVLITIDTPGGLDSSMRSIIKSILGSRIAVICYTAPSGARAASAGTFIMMGCPVSAMAPGTNIGAAHPVGVTGAIEQSKVTNDAAAFIASLANQWGRNADWAKQAVRESTSLTAETAVAMRAVDLLEPSTNDLLAVAGSCTQAPRDAQPTATGLLARSGPIPGLCGAATEAFDMSLTERLFHAFADPNVAFILLNIGLIALIVWVIHPALHVSLVVGVVCTVLGFLILQTLPVRLSGLILLIVAAVLFVLDVKAKTHGVLTAGGLAVLILGGLLLFNPSVPTARVSLPLLIVIAAAIASVMIFVVRAIVAVRGTPPSAGQEALIGEEGVAVWGLSPEGLVRARKETWPARSVGPPIAQGAPVRVVRVEGIRLIVEPLEEEDPARPARPGAKGGNP